MRDASRANANQAGALTQRHLRAGAQNFVFISWSCLQLSGFNFMNKKNLLKSFSDAATTTRGRDVSLLYSAAIFRPPPGTHFLHCIYLLAKMSQKKVKATPKVDEMRTSVAADLQDAVEFVVSFNSFSFPALRPLLHQMAGGKIFPFNLAGSLPRGVIHTTCTYQSRQALLGPAGKRGGTSRRQNGRHRAFAGQPLWLHVTYWWRGSNHSPPPRARGQSGHFR